MTRNKKIGLLWLIGPTVILLLTLSAFAISSFVAATIKATNSAAINSAIVSGTDPINAVQTGSLRQTVVKSVNVFLSLLGLVAVLGIFAGIPIGISFLNKKDLTEADITTTQKLPAYAGLTPEQVQYIHNWSWGAFLGGTIWPLGNKLWLWFFLSLIPIVNLYGWIKLSMHGRQMAWEKGGWENFDQFKKRQKIMAWVIGVFIILSIISAFIPESNSTTY